MLRKLLYILLLVSLLTACQTGVTETPGETAHATPSPQAAPPQVPVASPTPVLLATPYSQSPAAGICAPVDGEFVTYEIFPDIPTPRCAFAHPEQKLKLINRTDVELQVGLGAYQVTLAPGQEQVIAIPLGDYLAPGVHSLWNSVYYGGGGPELWLIDDTLSPTLTAEAAAVD